MLLLMSKRPSTSIKFLSSTRINSCMRERERGTVTHACMYMYVYMAKKTRMDGGFYRQEMRWSEGRGRRLRPTFDYIIEFE